MDEKVVDPPVLDAEYTLQFCLTYAQREAAQAILNCVHKGRSVLVDAVCGAGKTELVYPVIRECLQKGKRVGFAISRRQVVLQVAERIGKDFPGIQVIPVCGGHTDVTEGDMIVCTTHQLYRYHHYFDVLILDEPDAYPFSGNETLRGIALNSVKGPVIYLSATADEWIWKMVREHTIDAVHLYARPTGRPVPVPLIHLRPGMMKWISGFCWYRKEKKEHRRALIFMPTIRMAERMGKLFPDAESLTSQTKNKDQVIQKFMDKKTEFLFTTTILERGVTFPGIDVLVFQADHRVFTKSSLLQIAGRVGRDWKDPEGQAVFIMDKRTREAEECREDLIKANCAVFGAEKNWISRKISGHGFSRKMCCVWNAVSNGIQKRFESIWTSIR